MRLLQRNAKVDDALRRRLRAVDRRAVRARRRSSPVDWFFFVNGVEGSQGRGVRARPRRRPRLVGPPRLGGGDGRARRRRLVPRAVPARPRRQAPAGAHRVLAAGRARLQGRQRPARQGRRRRGARRPGRELHEGDAADPRRAVAGDPRRPGGQADRARARRSAASSRGMAPDGRRSRCSTRGGHVARTLGPGTGLVAATSVDHGKPVWVVTGTDVRGLTDAARSRCEEGVAAQPLRARDRPGHVRSSAPER